MFFFYNPMNDPDAIETAKLEDAKIKALEYIGKEDLKGEIINRVIIYEAKVAEVIIKK